jgi:hypothetical protein
MGGLFVYEYEDKKGWFVNVEIPRLFLLSRRAFFTKVVFLSYSYLFVVGFHLGVWE